MPDIFKRQIVHKQIKDNLARTSHLLQIMVGPRQVGKTTAVQQLLDIWPSQTLYLTADQLTPPTTEFIADGWRRARQLKGNQPLLVIDEVQKIRHWSDAVKLYHDEDHRTKSPLRVILLGSSALLLQRGLSESLAGRFQLIRCPHWSFTECRDAFGWSLKDFLFYGGYPAGAALIDHYETWRSYIQDSLLETVIGRDIPTLRRIDNPALFRQTLTLACQQPAEIISLQKLIGQLQDRGSMNTVAHYLELLSASFLVEPLRKWSSRPLRIRHSSPKLIVRNNALINALRNVPRDLAEQDSAFYGRLIENAVGASFLNTEKELYYWNERDKEVDFVLKDKSKIIAIEVKSSDRKRANALSIFKSRHPHCETVRIGGVGADLSLEEFFIKGMGIS